MNTGSINIPIPSVTRAKKINGILIIMQYINIGMRFNIIPLILLFTALRISKLCIIISAEAWRIDNDHMNNDSKKGKRIMNIVLNDN